MNFGPLLFLGIFLTFITAWIGLVFMPAASLKNVKATVAEGSTVRQSPPLHRPGTARPGRSTSARGVSTVIPSRSAAEPITTICSAAGARAQPPAGLHLRSSRAAGHDAHRAGPGQRRCSADQRQLAPHPLLRPAADYARVDDGAVPLSVHHSADRPDAFAGCAEVQLCLRHDQPAMPTRCLRT